MADKERRGIVEEVTFRADVAGPTVSGYAALYNTETTIAGFFRERIAPGAFRTALSGEDDVRALFNHDSNMVLGRTRSGTLVLSETKKGLRYDIELNEEDPEAMSVRAKIKRGDVSGSSFGFIVRAEEWQEPKDRRDLPLRTVTDAELFDVSPVTFPAYPQTSVTARSLEDVVKSLQVVEAMGIRRRLQVRIALERAKAWAS
jgi:HK97 family phage prohead protease